MKQEILLWCAEYMVFVGAIVVIIFLQQQSTIPTALIMFLTLAVTITSLWYLGTFLKFIIRKERPAREKGVMTERDKYSFPSMHSITIASATTYIVAHSVPFGIIMFFVACIVMYTRVRTHMHYAIDMVAGFCLGAVFTYIFSPVFEIYISNYIFAYIGY